MKTLTVENINEETEGSKVSGTFRLDTEHQKLWIENIKLTYSFLKEQLKTGEEKRNFLSRTNYTGWLNVGQGIRAIKGIYLHIYNPVIESIKETTEKKIDSLKNYYHMDNMMEIEEYLRNNQDLLAVIQEAQKRIFDIFGDIVTLHLRVVGDPEGLSEKLYIVIRTTGTLQEMSNSLNILDEWLLNLSSDILTRLNIYEQYV